jgi:signal transduction histidine kinase
VPTIFVLGLVQYNSDLLIQMDFDRMVQVFVNLINNAIQAMDKNGDITIRLLKVENKAVVEVSDMGVGIEEVELKKIFSPFYMTKSDGTLFSLKSN